MKINETKGTDYTSLINQTASQTKTSKTAAASAQSDAVELSSEGLQASYDLAKVMRIHKESKEEIPSKEDSDYYWNARANDKELDQSLYDADKAEAMEFVGQIQSILMKAIAGQKLTQEEQEMVNSDPALAQEIERRKAEASAGTFQTE